MNHKFTLCLVGRSGCGKGTQAKFLLERLRAEGVFHMETGRFLRELLAAKNPTTQLAQEVIMGPGGLFPWWFPMFLWLREIIEHGHAGEHMIGDGTPRRIAEAKFLDDVMSWHKRPLPLCIYVDVSEEEVTHRLLTRGRADDNVAAIRNRMDYFAEAVLPMIDHYEEHDRLISVDGNLPPDQVWRQIDRMLGERLGDQWPRA